MNHQFLKMIYYTFLNDNLIETLKDVVEAGATTINLPNTVERYRPMVFVEMVKNEEFIQEIMLDGICEARSTAYAAQRYNRTDLISPEIIPEIEETYNSLKKDKQYKKKKIEPNLALFYV